LFTKRHPIAASQESSVQLFPSLQAKGVPATQPLAGLHVSTPLQMLWSSQLADSVTW
jgi:hypothetical protein